MTTYTYSILSVEKEDQGDLQEVITSLKYRLEATDGVHVAEVFGELELDPPSSPSFIAFQFLTKQEIQDWIEAKVDSAQLKQELNEKLKVLQDS